MRVTGGRPIERVKADALAQVEGSYAEFLEDQADGPGNAAAWNQTFAKVQRKRMRLRRRLRDATNRQEVAAVLADLTWET